jgi:hypothetical protein
MMNRSRILVCAVLALCACSPRDMAGPRTALAPERPMYRVSPTYEPPKPSTRPPDVEGAAAAEAEALRRIEAHVSAETWSHLLTILNTPGSMIVATQDPRLSDLLTKYYEAHFRANDERYRQQWFVDTSHLDTIQVVVALGEPRDRALAELLWRPTDYPPPVILLRSDANPEVLRDALQSLDEWRARNDHRRLGEFRASVFLESGVQLDAARRAQLAQLLEKLRSAETREIKGMGTLRAIDVRSPLGAR